MGYSGCPPTGQKCGKRAGFGTVDQARITTAISELARNIYSCMPEKVRFVLRKQFLNGKSGLKITARDNGPGISDIRRVMEDGYTTSGGLGAGLPGVKRLMDEFDIQSKVGWGTSVIAVKWLR